MGVGTSKVVRAKRGRRLASRLRTPCGHVRRHWPMELCTGLPGSSLRRHVHRGLRPGGASPAVRVGIPPEKVSSVDDFVVGLLRRQNRTESWRPCMPVLCMAGCALVPGTWPHPVHAEKALRRYGRKTSRYEAMDIGSGTVGGCLHVAEKPGPCGPCPGYPSHALLERAFPCPAMDARGEARRGESKLHGMGWSVAFGGRGTFACPWYQFLAIVT